MYYHNLSLLQRLILAEHRQLAIKNLDVQIQAEPTERSGFHLALFLFMKFLIFFLLSIGKK